MAKAFSITGKGIEGLVKMLTMRERDNLYGESRETKEYFVADHEKSIAKGFPTPIKKCLEVAQTVEDLLVHSVPGAESSKRSNQSTPIA